MKREAGFTLVELVITVALTGIIVVFLGVAIYQMYTVTEYGNSGLTALHELQNAARWFNYDGQRALSANITGGLVLAISANTTIQYALTGTELTRTTPAGQMVLAQNISTVDFSLSDRLLTMELTSSPPGREAGSKTGTYRVFLRPSP